MKRKQPFQLAFALLVVVIGFAPAAVFGEEMKWRTVSYVSKFEVKPVGDVDGHVSGSFARRGLSLFDHGEVATVTNLGTIDVTKGAGTYKGEGTWVFEDGSTFTADLEGQVEPLGGGKTAHKGSGRILRGTGRFSGITGNFSYTGKSMTPYGAETKSETYYDTVGTYTLPNR